MTHLQVLLFPKLTSRLPTLLLLVVFRLKIGVSKSYSCILLTLHQVEDGNYSLYKTTSYCIHTHALYCHCYALRSPLYFRALFIYLSRSYARVGETSLVLEERSAVWINLHDFFRPIRYGSGGGDDVSRFGEG